MALIGHAVAEMFEYFGHMHVYSPRAGADTPLGTKCFHGHKSSVPLHASSLFEPKGSCELKIGIPMHTKVLPYKSVVHGVFTDTLS